MRTLDRLGELHLIADEHDRAGRRRHGDNVAQRDLSRLVDEEHVAAAAKFFASKEPGCSGDDGERQIDGGVVRYTLDVTQTLKDGVVPVLFMAELLDLPASFLQTLLDGMQDVVDHLVAVGGDADLATLGDERRDDVGNRVGLACARRSLDHQRRPIERAHRVRRGGEKFRGIVPRLWRDHRGSDATPYEAGKVPPKQRSDMGESWPFAGQVRRCGPDGIAQHHVIERTSRKEGDVPRQCALCHAALHGHESLRLIDRDDGPRRLTRRGKMYGAALPQLGLLLGEAVAERQAPLLLADPVITVRHAAADALLIIDQLFDAALLAVKEGPPSGLRLAPVEPDEIRHELPCFAFGPFSAADDAGFKRSLLALGGLPLFPA